MAAGNKGRNLSLALREENGSLSVVGLTETEITSADEAMEQLRAGTLHRTTASTLMNTVSSRSHAVFTITLRQVPTSPTSPVPAVSSSLVFGAPARAVPPPRRVAGGDHF